MRKGPKLARIHAPRGPARERTRESPRHGVCPLVAPAARGSLVFGTSMCALALQNPAAAPAVSCRGLVRRYPKVVAVDGLDLEVRSGECFGLLGPNGAGKTTTIEICEGLTPADSGEVVILGRRWGTDDRQLRELLGISLQETQFSEKLSVA